MPKIFVTDCDKYIERKLALMGTHCTFTLRGEEREVVFRGVIDGEESETECDYFARISLETEMCKGMCDMYSDCTHIADLETSVQIEFVNKSARKLVV